MRDAPFVGVCVDYSNLSKGEELNVQRTGNRRRWNCRGGCDWNYRGGRIPFVLLNGAIWLCCVGAYGVNRFWIKEISDNTFMHCYFNDVHAMPVLLAYSNILVALTGQQRWEFTSFTRVVPLAVACGLFWEYVAPLFKPSAVTDPWDLCAYMAGAVFYVMLVAGCRRWYGNPSSSRTRVQR